jgi:CRISPR/Cas system endoribonuclease Cas6 (RAMP superfamily)
MLRRHAATLLSRILTTDWNDEIPHIKKAPRKALFLCRWRELLLANQSAEALVETVNTTTGVNDLLLASVERVAFRANVQVQTATSGADREFVTARALHVDRFVLWVDTFFHGQPLVY